MSIIECISAGCMMTGLILGAITGSIAMLLMPVGIGTLMYVVKKEYTHKKEHTTNIYQYNYPPYGY